MVGTPKEDIRPGRAVRITEETPDLLADLGDILPALAERGAALFAGADLLNRLAEYGWTIIRTDVEEERERLAAKPDDAEATAPLGCLLVILVGLVLAGFWFGWFAVR